jgi:perosamine synthetase
MSVFIGSIPNVQEDDVSLARAILKGNIDIEDAQENLKEALSTHLQISKEQMFLFNRGRDSLSLFLSLLNLKKDDEVITQAFTCVAVVAPILRNKAKPVYIDIDPKTFNLNPSLLEANINAKTRVIIVQHTFGNIFEIEKLRNIVDKINTERTKERKIYIIEDCAHLFPSLPNQLGKHSDMFFFSFSQDKAISCTQGAMMVVREEELLEIAQKEYTNVPKPLEKEAKYNAKYIQLWSKIKRNYFSKLIPFTNITKGRVMIIVFRTLGLIKKQAGIDTISEMEIMGMSPQQCVLLLNQLSKVKKFNNHRRNIVALYNTNLRKEFRYESNSNELLRYPILLSNKEELKERFKKEQVIVGNWYKTPVYPLDSQLQEVRYAEGSCPVAQRAGEFILNLPTSIETNRDDVMKVIEIVNTFAKPVNI